VDAAGEDGDVLDFRQQRPDDVDARADMQQLPICWNPISASPRATISPMRVSVRAGWRGTRGHHFPTYREESLFSLLAPAEKLRVKLLGNSAGLR